MIQNYPRNLILSGVYLYLFTACAGATYVVTVRTAAFLTNKDWAWNHLAGGLASGAFIGYAGEIS